MTNVIAMAQSVDYTTEYDQLEKVHQLDLEAEINFESGQVLPVTNRGNKEMLDSLIGYRWDTVTNEYRPSTNERYLYNEDEKCVNYSVSFWSSSKNSLVPGYSYAYIYGANGERLEQYRSKYDGVKNQFYMYSRFEYHYNANNLLTHYDYYLWDSTANLWVLNYKLENSYRTNNQIEIRNGFAWNDSTKLWEDDYRENHYFDTSDYKIKYEERSFSTVTNVWKLGLLDEYINDSVGNLSQTIRFEAGISSGQMELTEKLNSDYDSLNREIQKLEYMWNPGTFQWDLSARSFRTYTSANDVAEIISQHRSGSNWVTSARHQYTYHFGFPSTDLVIPFTNYFNDKILEIKSWQWDGVQWPEPIKSTYFYSDFKPTSVQVLKENTINAYPNPFTNELSFDLPTSETFQLELYDVQGKLVWSQQVRANQKVPTSKLENGLYFYSIRNNKNVFQGKLVKN
jgi:hypothetical protein